MVKYFKKYIFILLLMHSAYSIYGQVWPMFISPETPGVSFDQENAALRTIDIYADENMIAPFLIAKLNYNGEQEPVVSYNVGSKDALGLNVRNDGTNWLLEIKNVQDYENIRRYMFSLIIETYEYQVYLFIVNLFDNNPTIRQINDCLVEELYIGLTNCSFVVFDPDGIENNEFSFSIEGDHDESQLFQLINNSSSSAEKTVTYTLKTLKELNYRDRVMFIFNLNVYDIVNNSGNTIAVIQVDDVPNLPPVWTQPFATARFIEKQSQTFHVTAIDGDTKINNDICYLIEFEDDKNYEDFIAINEASGEISIKPIDRDALNQETFLFNIIAYECVDENSSIQGQAVLIVDDINDNSPEITLDPMIIQIFETTYLTLDFVTSKVNDIDLGSHATYSIHLEPQPYASAFNVIPGNGYQETNFLISVIDADLLDYEDVNWREFDLTIIATENANISHYNEETIKIKLLDRNDEIPTFSDDEFEVSVYENVTKNFEIITCLAIDRDATDIVNHSIVGGMNNILSIDNDGKIQTITEEPFDYERQNKILVQIRATDTIHTTFAQLTINILDVNDETPEIRMLGNSVEIIENSKAGTVVTTGILATDPDIDAELIFEILWEKSYATKTGQFASEELYTDCFIIVPHPESPNKVYGHLIVNENFAMLIDYEAYDIIYLTIRVTDNNQTNTEFKNNFAEGVLTVPIVDLNDNAPEFIHNTLNVSRSVVEGAIDDTLVGTIHAIDYDGPNHNTVKFSMFEIDGSDAKLLQIDESTGVISVIPGSNIDCDIPKIEYLEYEIKISDNDHFNNGNIRIYIIDTNNKVPQFDTFVDEIYLPENAPTGEFITKIIAYDNDRDMPHNVLQYMINFAQNPELSQYFEIHPETGVLQVSLVGNSVLDRETKDTYKIPIKVVDNYQGTGRPNDNETTVTLILTDINDNSPEMPKPSDFSPRVLENATTGVQIGPDFIAFDKDQENTPNSEVIYTIMSITNAEDVSIEANIFEISNFGPNIGRLLLKQSLKGFYGVWNVKIQASDKGEPPLKSEETYPITVDPINYNYPKILFPTTEPIRLRTKNQTTGTTLYTVINEELDLFTAEDDDGLHFGDVNFTITNSISDSGDADIFEIFKISRNTARLQLKSGFEEKYYRLNVQATDGGDFSSAIENVAIVFIDINGEPVFLPPGLGESDIIEFTEEEKGLEENKTLREAEDPKNEGITIENEKFKIYYFIDTSFNANDAEFFKLDPVTRALTLNKKLDRETKDVHEIHIIATNEKTAPANFIPGSVMNLTINVKDINDNPPHFKTNMYSSGITDNDNEGKSILFVEAIDPDKEDVISYYILTESITTVGQNIENTKLSMFKLAPTTGVLTLASVPKDTMSGFYEFQIEARDLEQHSSQCIVKIYIIAEMNRITFVFQNSTEELNTVENIAIMANIFSEQFQNVCNIDDVRGYDKEIELANQLTNVRAHFINNNSEAIEAEKIHERIANPVFLAKLKGELLEKSLFLADVPNDIVIVEANMEGLLRTLLIVVSVVLGSFCIILLAAFIIRTRSLNRQLKALSPTDFGSTSSNLNRREVPTSNVYAIEGKNPVLNHNDNTKFDALSIQSDESDFDKDFDKDPTFMMNHESDSKNSALIEEIRRKSINPITSNGGEKIVPISPEYYPPRHM